MCHFSILLHFLPELADLAGLDTPSGPRIKQWLTGHLRTSAGERAPEKLVSQATSTIINGGKTGLVHLLTPLGVTPTQLLLNVCDYIAARSRPLCSRLRALGLTIPPMDEYKRLGAYIQRCESKVMLTILSLLCPEHPVSVVWLHDGLYLHHSFNKTLATHLCQKGATVAGFPHLAFKLTQETLPAPTDPEPGPDDSEAASPQVGILGEAFAPFKRRRIRVGF